MSSPTEIEASTLSFENLKTASNGEIVGASLRDLRKVLLEGPEPFSQKADGARNEVLIAVLDLKNSLLDTNESLPEDRQNLEKLFNMSSEEIVRIAECARPNLVRLMRSALRCEETLSPRTSDPSTASGVLSVVLKWRLDASNQALQDSLAMNRTPAALQSASQRRNDGASTAENPSNEAVPPATLDNPITISPVDANPFAADDQNVNQMNKDLLSMLDRSTSKKRSPELLTLKDVHKGKRVRFSTLGQMNGESQEGSGQSLAQDFRKGGSPVDQLPPHLMGEYIGRRSTKFVLRVFDFKGGEIIAGLLQEGTTIEMAVRNRSWKRSLTGEPYQGEQEAVTLARVIHLSLMCFATVEDALAMAPWLETCLRRLFAILYVEEHSRSAPRVTLWKVAGKMLETQVESTLQVPGMAKLMAQNATLYSKEQNALVSLSKKQTPLQSENRKRKRDNLDEQQK